MKAVSKTSRLFEAAGSRLLSVVTLLIGVCLSAAVSAQAIDDEQTAKSLKTKVHLRRGETTLAGTLQELSRQTGLRIQAAAYLQERELVVELDNLSAQAALDTLAEGNDWTWYETQPGRILVTRPGFNKTKQLLEVADAFRVIVPKDLRRFVGLDLSDDEIRSAFRYSLPDHDISLKEHSAALEIAPPRIWLLPGMLEAPVDAQARQMISWVTDEVRSGKKIPYAQLTHEQQHALLVRFVFTAMHSVFSPGPMCAANLIMGLNPAGVDENQMVIRLVRDDLSIGTWQALQQGRASYGEGIMSEKQLPDPLLLHTDF